MTFATTRHRSPAPLTILALTPLILTACGGGDEPAAPEGPALFTVEVSGETFAARVADPVQVAAMEARMASGREGVITGELRAGDGGFNAPWSWHWDPATVEVADVSTEVCDGRPSFVEDDLEYWLEVLGRYCPWGAVVVERIE